MTRTSPQHGPPPLRLRIERLVLDGLPCDRGQAEQLRGALERELAQLWHEQQNPTATAQSLRARSLRAPDLASGAGASPAQLGRAAAHSLFSLLRDVR